MCTNKYVVGIGAVSIDEFYTTKKWPEVGSKTLVHKDKDIIGGMIPNVLSTLSLMGIDTYLIDTLPNNGQEKPLKKDLDNYDINYSYCSEDDIDVNKCFIINYEGEKTIFISESKRNEIELSEKHISLLTKAEYTYGLIGDILKFKNVDSIFNYLLENVNFALDIESFNKDISEKEFELVKRAKVLFFNQFGYDEFKQYYCIEDINFKDKIIVITKGKGGASAICNEDRYYSTPQKVEVVDTTGAGDCFNGVFLSKLIMGSNIQEALDYATKIATFSVGYRGPKLTENNFSQIVKKSI